MSALFAFLHHLAAFALIAILLAERVLIADLSTPAQARRLMRIDAFYGLSAGTILVVGLMRVFMYEKGGAYYAHNLPFLIKAGLFVVIGLLSIRPTLTFLSWRGALRANVMPAIDAAKLAGLKRLISLQLILVVPLLLCAALMARGYGQLG